jgi:hypothetical protein
VDLWLDSQKLLGLYYRFFKDSQGNTLGKLFELFVELEKRQKKNLLYFFGRNSTNRY